GIRGDPRLPVLLRHETAAFVAGLLVPAGVRAISKVSSSTVHKTHDTSTYANLLLGNGDGTFRATSTTLIDSKTLSPGRSLTVAEFTGDGNLDVLVGPARDYFPFCAGIVQGIYLRNPDVFVIGQGAGDLLPGKGDGALDHLQSYDVFSTAVADFD